MQSLGSIGILAGLGPHGVVGAPAGYVFLRVKNANGTYSTLSGVKADASRANLVGKAS